MSEHQKQQCGRVLKYHARVATGEVQNAERVRETHSCRQRSAQSFACAVIGSHLGRERSSIMIDIVTKSAAPLGIRGLSKILPISPMSGIRPLRSTHFSAQHVQLLNASAAPLE